MKILQTNQKIKPLHSKIMKLEKFLPDGRNTLQEKGKVPTGK